MKHCLKCGMELPPRRRKFCSIKCINRHYDIMRSGSVERILTSRRSHQRNKEKEDLEKHNYYLKHKAEIDARHKRNAIKRKIRALTYWDVEVR